MRTCKTCDGHGEQLVPGIVDSREPHLVANVEVETCPDCQGTGEVENKYQEKFN